MWDLGFLKILKFKNNFLKIVLGRIFGFQNKSLQKKRNWI